MTIASILLQGGLGNQMFQLAFLYAYGKRYPQLRLAIYNPDYISHHSKATYTYLIQRFTALPNYTRVGFTPQHVQWEKASSEWKYVNYSAISDDTLFQGFFQSPLYFHDHQQAIRHMFREPDGLGLENYPDSVFLHVRLGDYISHPFLFLGRSFYEEYYKTSLASLPPDCTVRVFSDDIEFAREMYPFIFEDSRVVVENEPDAVRALYKMARCRKGGIASNSTMSWWALYLNPEKTVSVLPDIWHTRINSVQTGLSGR